MAWFFLFLAGLLEVAFAMCLKLANNFTNLKWTVLFLICYVGSILLLNKAIQTIPLGTGYAIWTGIGAAGTVALGILFFKEPVDFWRLFFICTLITSIVGLKWVSAD